MCGSPPLLVTDGATHVKNIAAGRSEQIIDEAIGPTIISWLSYTPKLRLLIRSAEKYRDAQNSNFVQCTSPRRIISSSCGRDSWIWKDDWLAEWGRSSVSFVQWGDSDGTEVNDFTVKLCIGYHSYWISRRRKNRINQSAYGAVVDNSIKVETTRSVASEFSELCSRKRLG